MQNLEEFQLQLGQDGELAMALSLSLMMFAVALNLRWHHFAAIARQPKVFVAGVGGQILILPLLTLFMCYLFNPIPSVALGMILVACCPGGNVSNILVLLGRGNTALSVALTATSSLAAALLTPVSILFWSGLYGPTAELLTQINFDPLSFLAQTSLILALPLLLGMACVKRLPDFSARIKNPLAALSSVLLIGIIVFACIKYWSVFLTLGAAIIGIVVLQNAAAFAAGNLLARAARADVASRRSLTIEVGIQNSGLGIVILLTQLGGLGGAAAVAGLWGTWHIIAGLILVALFRVADRRAAAVVNYAA
ncbi:MAG: bile acid:sodium symporter family protein [Gammaproteobacteria bacterium]|nr:bile acid:sodium symporter family protein [Gammaproteobacteria bacterium]